MNKIRIFFLGLITISVASANNAYSYSVIKPSDPIQLFQYTKGIEFIKLSYQQFADLTGQKASLKNKISFYIVKAKVRHEIKKDPNFRLTNLFATHNSGFLRILFWIIIGFFVLIGLFLLIFGLAPR